MDDRPISEERLGIMRCVLAPEPRTMPNGTVRRDRDGNTQWITGISVRHIERRTTYMINVVTLVRPEGVAEGSVVTVTNLWSREWDIDGRKGTSWRADEIRPVASVGGSGKGHGAAAGGSSRGKPTGGEG
ncbi:hypothetical protein [Streptomyces sp. NPDC059063]|uniref:hypothetical protein n=1 Tax=unclassified Streptomyces TaxID=2593676 RepID=UPI0036D02857